MNVLAQLLSAFLIFGVLALICVTVLLKMAARQSDKNESASDVPKKLVNE